MGDDSGNQKKGKTKWNTNMTLVDAEERLGLDFELFQSQAVSVSRMLEGLECDVTKEVILKTKELVYDLVVRHIEVEGYPTMANGDFREPNVNDLVLLILNPILSDFRRSTGRNIRLRREKQIISIDGETGGDEEFVVMDVIKIKEKRFVFVVESKKSSIGEGMKQCLLTMKDMRDNNGTGEVYGFITTGDSWRMFSYNGVVFQMTRKIEAVFEGMDQERELWMKEYSIVVDCMYGALSKGGIMEDVVVG